MSVKKKNCSMHVEEERFIILYFLYFNNEKIDNIWLTLLYNNHKNKIHFNKCKKMWYLYLEISVLV